MTGFSEAMESLGYTVDFTLEFRKNGSFMLNTFPAFRPGQSEPEVQEFTGRYSLTKSEITLDLEQGIGPWDTVRGSVSPNGEEITLHFSSDEDWVFRRGSTHQ